MLPVIIIIFSSLILLFTILRKKAVKSSNEFKSNLDKYLDLSPTANLQTKTATLLDAATKNLSDKKDISDKKHTIQTLSSKRLLSTKQLDILMEHMKELEYEELVILSEAENLKPNWDIFTEAAKQLPSFRRREEKNEKENLQKENSFYNRKKETLEASLINRLKNE